jgi:hypothetical protein
MRTLRPSLIQLASVVSAREPLETASHLGSGHERLKGLYTSLGLYMTLPKRTIHLMIVAEDPAALDGEGRLTGPLIRPFKHHGDAQIVRTQIEDITRVESTILVEWRLTFVRSDILASLPSSYPPQEAAMLFALTPGKIADYIASSYQLLGKGFHWVDCQPSVGHPLLKVWNTLAGRVHYVITFLA